MTNHSRNMKKGYQYVRISQNEQSNWSISGQQEMNLRYADKHGIQIVKTFIDDGRSAKDFERPAWKELEKVLNKNRSQVDYLIISKYDRLIRNALQGLQQLEKIEQKWKVQVLSAMESYAIDPTDPMYFKIRADLLVNGEFERRVISDRSKFGTWQAKLQGRHIGHAPFGYVNARDDRNRPIIVMDASKKAIIVEIFERYLNGDHLKVIAETARAKGFQIRGRSAIPRVLKNPVYAGLILVPSYKGNPEKLVDAIHEPMIDRYTFYEVQDKLRAKAKHVKISLHEEMPLRGLILCEGCGMPLTGGRSKGKGGYYFYYRCLKCSGQNHSVIKSHKQLDQIFELLSFEQDTIKQIHDAIVSLHKRNKSGSQERIRSLKRDLDSLRKKIDSLEEKFIRDAVTPQTYDKWSSRLNRDLSGKEHELQSLEALDDSVLFQAKYKLEKMCDLKGAYNEMSVLKKQDLFKCVFPKSSIKSQEGYRTQKVSELFSHNLFKFKGLEVLEVIGNDRDFAKIPTCTRSGTIIEQIDQVNAVLKVG